MSSSVIITEVTINAYKCAYNTIKLESNIIGITIKLSEDEKIQTEKETEERDKREKRIILRSIKLFT